MKGMAFFAVVAVLIIGGILALLRSRKLKEKYAALWLVVGILCVVLVAFPSLLARAAGLVGIQVASNLLFTLAIILLLAVCLHLSLELSTHENHIRRLAEESAILRAELERQVAATPGGPDRVQGSTSVVPRLAHDEEDVEHHAAQRGNHESQDHPSRQAKA